MKHFSLLLLFPLAALPQGPARSSDPVAYNVALAAPVRANTVASSDPLFPYKDGVAIDFPRPPAGKILRVDSLTLRQLPGPVVGPLCGIYNNPDTIFLEMTPSGAHTGRLVHLAFAYEAIFAVGYGNPAIIRSTPGIYVEGGAGIFRINAAAPCTGSGIEITISGVLLDSSAVSQPAPKPTSVSVYQVTVEATLNAIAIGGGKTYLDLPLPPAGKVLGVEQVWIRHTDGPINTQVQYCQAEIGLPGLRSAVAQVGFPAPTDFYYGQTVASRTPFYVPATAGAFRIACGENGLLGKLTATVVGTLYDQGK